MKVAFLTRKNLVALAISALFAFNFIVIGVLVCNVPSVNDFIWSMGFNIIETKLISAADQVGLIFTGVFIFVLAFAVIGNIDLQTRIPDAVESIMSNFVRKVQFF